MSGVFFVFLWASASTATKIALQSSQPLVIAQVRFAVAGIAMLIYAHVFRKQRLTARRRMEANYYLWFAQYYYLPRLLCCRDAARNRRSGHVGRVYQSFVHQFYFSFFLEEKIEIQDNCCFTVWNVGSGNRIMAIT